MALDMFLVCDDLPGESKDKKFAGKIDVLAWSFGASNSGSAHVGGGAGAGKANVQDLSLTKHVDQSSPNIFLFTCNGKHIKEVKLIVRKAGEKPLEYLIMTLSEVMITSYSTGGSGGVDRLTENITLNFAKIEIQYTPQKATGDADKPITSTWDIAANSKD